MYEIKDLKDLKNLLKACRAIGVTEITIPELSLKLGEKPIPHPSESIEDQVEYENALDTPLTNEELTAWANGADTQ